MTVAGREVVRWDAYVFFSILVDSQMNCAERTPANFLLDNVLVDSMLSGPIVLAIAIFGPGIQRFLQ